jgi:hypothetical protein
MQQISNFGPDQIPNQIQIFGFDFNQIFQTSNFTNAENNKLEV